MARRFRFRLESLLRLRRSLEENAQRGLARALAQLDQARTRLAQLRQDRMEALESRSLPPGQPVDLERWRAVERWVLALELQKAEGLRRRWSTEHETFCS